MNNTLIEWCDKTWNPVTGCPGPRVSPGCDHCYAERVINTRLRHLYNDAYPFEEIHFHIERLMQPWRMKKSSRIFVSSMGDLFHDTVQEQYINLVFAVAALCPQHTFMLLTKRPERMRSVLIDTSTTACDDRGHAYKSVCQRACVDANMDGLPWPLPNVWLGVTVCNQQEADKKVPLLLQTPAAKRFVSVEPMLGPVIIEASVCPECGSWEGVKYPRGDTPYCEDCGADPVAPKNGLDWVIVGGETGPNARSMHPAWVRSLRDQCQDANVPFFFKGWGEWTAEYTYDDAVRYAGGFVDGTPFARIGKTRSGRLLDGREWNEVPK